jgi:hypothetical protein
MFVNEMTTSSHILPNMNWYLLTVGLYFELHSNIRLNYVVSFNENSHMTLNKTNTERSTLVFPGQNSRAVKSMFQNLKLPPQRR